MYIESEASQSASRGSRIVGETGHGAKSSCRPVAVAVVSESEKREVVRAAAGRIREADVREQFRKSCCQARVVGSQSCPLPLFCRLRHLHSFLLILNYDPLFILFFFLTCVLSLGFAYCSYASSNQFQPGPWRILGNVAKLAPLTNRYIIRGKRRSSSRSSLVR